MSASRASRPATASTDATPRPPQSPFDPHPPPPSISTDDTSIVTTTTATATAAATATNTAATIPRPPFAPFFTLIQDATTSSHFHPTVRYVFSDDDFDPLAVLPQPHESPTPGSLANSHQGGSPLAHSGSGSQADVDSNHGGSGTFGKAHRRRGAEMHRGDRTGHVKQISSERVVLVDVSADGTGILAAHSLSPDWQINAVSVSKAPTWLNEDSHSHSHAHSHSTTTHASTTTYTTAATRSTTTNTHNQQNDSSGGGNGSGEGGLMLTIEGVGRHHRKTSEVLPLNLPSKDGKGKTPVDALEELVGVYAERLERLQSVVDWAEGRKPVGGNAGGSSKGAG
ncbi:hypothetical protein Dda_3091 [Drechslerella dactyloides]|uniref:Uncharacterized protein n=1 Tax=Drechslerella dactyloides TaxID=74499 RepID=A0AAD6NKX7_DREDA|nr:hypothetical protein Dda_3091 [Drechslerella dactyloides]